MNNNTQSIITSNYLYIIYKNQQQLKIKELLLS
jgi:hypothetical protein